MEDVTTTVHELYSSGPLLLQYGGTTATANAKVTTSTVLECQYCSNTATALYYDSYSVTTTALQNYSTTAMRCCDVTALGYPYDSTRLHSYEYCAMVLLLQCHCYNIAALFPNSTAPYSITGKGEGEEG
eukprot:2059701-Pyramimonas_sp.AAC.1